MRRHHYLIIVMGLAFLGFGAILFNSQAPTLRTNAPGENSCAGCHTGAVNTGLGATTLSLPTGGYIPGNTYTLTYTILDSSFATGIFGFTTTSLNGSNLKAGDFTATNPTFTTVQSASVGGNPRSYIGHVTANASNSWQYDWTAPSTNVGTVTFYTVGNAANNNAGNSGDHIFEETFTLDLLPTFPQPEFSASTSEICQTDSITFTNTSMGNITSYQWDFGAGASPATANTAGPHTVTYSTPGPKTVQLTTAGPDGSDLASQSVTVNSVPMAGSPPIQTDLCEDQGGAMVDLTVVGGTAPFNYSWTCTDPTNCGISNTSIEDPLLNPMGTMLPDTFYYGISISDSKGCQSSVDTQITLILYPLPIADAGPDTNLCISEPCTNLLQGGLAANNMAAGPYVFSWSPVNGLSNPNILNPVACPDTTTTYTLTITSVNGCESEINALSQVTVFVDDPTAEAGPDQFVCVGGSVQLMGSASGAGPNYQYVWSGGTFSDSTSATPTVSPNATTTYYLNVSSNNCAGSLDSVTVTVTQEPIADAGTDFNICEGDTLPLMGSFVGLEPDYQFAWSGEVNGYISDISVAMPTISPDSSGAYIFTVTSGIGCGSSSDTVQVTVDPAPIPTIDSTQLTDTLLASLGDSYQWYFFDPSTDSVISIAGATGATWPFSDFYFTPGNTGFVVVEVTYMNGCTRFSAAQELPVLASINSSVVERLDIYPNPTQSSFTIAYELNRSEAMKFQLLDLQGKQIEEMSRLGSGLSGMYDFDMSSLPKGVYLLQVQIGSSTLSRKIMKM